MKGHELQAIEALLTLIIIAGIANAQYWFQSGIRAGNGASLNNGAAVTIQTIVPQKTSGVGSFGFWVGEDIQNGAFLQVGYLIEPQTGLYPSYCSQTSCKNNTNIKAGAAEWFYEYFPTGYSGSFLGGIGTDSSVGVNGTFNRYSFYSIGTKWYFLFNGNTVGSVDLGASSSGANPPLAFGEIANTTDNKSYMKPVIFSNLSSYQNGVPFPVGQGFAYVGYGEGSKKNLPNPYGVTVLGNRTNYFQVGSGLPRPFNGTFLWSIGYPLRIVSSYGNLSNTTNYIANSKVRLYAPATINLGNSTRASFIGWQGSGLGSYTGPLRNGTAQVNGNITEVAKWRIDYYLSALSPYANSSGSGWYANGTIANYGIDRGIANVNGTTRFLFANWNNSNANLNGSVRITSPVSLRAIWRKQFALNATSQYGKISGNGWYTANSMAMLSLSATIINISSSQRLAFYSWSNGNRNQSFNLTMSRPTTISALFRNQYLTTFIPKDSSGAALNGTILYLNSQPIGNSAFLYQGTNYTIDHVYYKGVKMSINANVNVSSSGSLYVAIPVYNVTIATQDLFTSPVNTTVDLAFSNGTHITTYSGPRGMLSLKQVPYGYINGTVQYLGISQSVQTRGGTTYITFLSVYNLIEIAFVVLAIAVSYFVAREHLGKRYGTANNTE